MDPLIGKILGKYKIVEKVGAGGMADVYKGIQVGLEREVAVKVLPAACAADVEMVKRFRRESQATAKLNHPNIITIYDSGEQDGLYYYVMEYLRADSLEKIIEKEKRLQPKKALKIAQDILQALAYTHDKHILHRDLKPSNIKFDMRGNAIVTDFGLVKDLDQTSITMAGVSLGTPQYMSPEQLLGDSVDERSDLYQVGIVLYEMLTGQTPFGGKSPFVGNPSASVAEATPPSTHNPDIPGELDEVALKVLSKRPEDRYGSAKEMLAALKQVERKSSARQMSRQAPSSAKISRISSAQLQGAAFSGAGSSSASLSATGTLSLSAENLSIAIAKTLQGPSRNKVLAIAIPSLVLLGSALAYILTLVFPRPDLALLEKSFEVESDRAVISWRANYPCFSYVEYGLRPDSLVQTEIQEVKQTEFRQVLSGLEPDATYVLRFRFGYDLDPDSFSEAWTREYTIQTRPQIVISGIIVEPAAIQAKLSWVTNLKTDTVVRYGRTEEYGTTQSNFEQKAVTRHSITLQGLDPAVRYHFQILASDPDLRSGTKISPDQTFMTLESLEGQGYLINSLGNSRSEGDSEDHLHELAKSYVDKLTRMTPDERAKLKLSISKFINPGSGKPLNDKTKSELLTIKTHKQVFNDRYLLVQRWRSTLAAIAPDETDKTCPQKMLDRIQRLFQINPGRACGLLDRMSKKLSELEKSL